MKRSFSNLGSKAHLTCAHLEKFKLVKFRINCISEIVPTDLLLNVFVKVKMIVSIED